MTVNDARPQGHPGHAPAWSTVTAWLSLGLLVLAGLAGAAGIG